MFVPTSTRVMPVHVPITAAVEAMEPCGPAMTELLPPLLSWRIVFLIVSDVPYRNSIRDENRWPDVMAQPNVLSASAVKVPPLTGRATVWGVYDPTALSVVLVGPGTALFCQLAGVVG